MPEFFQTRMGARFFERDVPEIARQLARIADALERLATTGPDRDRPAGATPVTNAAPAPAEGEDPRDADADEPLTERS